MGCAASRSNRKGRAARTPPIFPSFENIQFFFVIFAMEIIYSVNFSKGCFKIERIQTLLTESHKSSKVIGERLISSSTQPVILFDPRGNRASIMAKFWAYASERRPTCISLSTFLCWSFHELQFSLLIYWWFGNFVIAKQLGSFRTKSLWMILCGQKPEGYTAIHLH